MSTLLHLEQTLLDHPKCATSIRPLGLQQTRVRAAFASDYVCWPEWVFCSGKMVKLTLWGSLAENEGAELESMSHPVLSVTACRVGDFDGGLLFPLQTLHQSDGATKSMESKTRLLALLQSTSNRLSWSIPLPCRCVHLISEPEPGADQP